MSGLRKPFTIKVELFLGSAWVDISSYVYQHAGLSIRRGRPNETSKVSPSSLAMTLNNRDGRFTPRLATGPYYGQIGRNTMVRVGLGVGLDAFGRTSASGWSTADSGQAWSAIGAGGTVAGTDCAVGSGVGTQMVPVANAHRGQLLDVSLLDADVYATVTLPVTDITGANADANILLRYVDSTHYYMVRVEITTAEVVQVSLVSATTTIVAAVATGLTHSSSQAIRIRAQVEGQTLHAKVWAASSAEPFSWTTTGHTTELSAPGKVGIRSGLATSNSNAPLTFSYDNFEVRCPRFIGELASVPQQWDISGNDQTINVDAAGILRRLGQGSSPVMSPLKRGLLSAAVPGLEAYWPCEDGATSASIASGIGGPAMTIYGGLPTFASSTSFGSSGALPQMKGSRWVGVVPDYADTGAVVLRWVMSVPSGGMTDQVTIARIDVGGTAPWWDIIYQTGGALILRAYDYNSNLLSGSAPINFAIDNTHKRYSLELVQSGSDVNWALVTLDYDTGGAVSASGTVTSVGIDAARAVFYQVSYVETMDTVSIGHVTVQSAYESLFSTLQPFLGWPGETAGARISRLCSENGVTFSYIGDLTTTAAMGRVSVKKLTDLIDECVAADAGSLYETRGTLGLAYRCRNALYNQSATLALNYASNHLATPPNPTDDDQGAVNDYTASRTNGSFARYVQETGRMSTLEPSSGGVGRYDSTGTYNVYRDTQLPDMASWAVHLGTVDEARYPTLAINLANDRILADLTLVQQALAVDVDHRITLSALTADVVSQIARGYSERLNAFELLLTFNTSPESPYQTVVLDAAVEGKIDTATSELVAAATTTDTTLLVSDYPSVGWTSSAGQMPIPIVVEGETMSVTACTAIAPTFVAAGVAATGNNASLVPAHPAGLAVGDLKCIFASIRNSGTGSVVLPTGWAQAYGAGNMALLVKIHVSGDTAPTVTFSGGVANADTIAQMCAFRGAAPTVYDSQTQLNGSAQNIAYPAGPTLPGNNFIVLYLGWKQDDWTSVATLTGATEIGEPDTTTGDDAGLVWDYVIQTTATAIPAGSFVVTGGASAISRSAVVVLDGNVQSMTVTRSVNGVVKTHATGAAVQLARPATLAL